MLNINTEATTETKTIDQTACSLQGHTREDKFDPAVIIYKNHSINETAGSQMSKLASARQAYYVPGVTILS